MAAVRPWTQEGRGFAHLINSNTNQAVVFDFMLKGAEKAVLPLKENNQEHDMEIKNLKLADLRLNPTNPREVVEEKYKQLIDSILVFPKMLELRPVVHNARREVLGGNMRLRALQDIAQMSLEDIKARLECLEGYRSKPQAERVALLEFWQRWLDSPYAPAASAEGLTDAEQQEFIIKDNLSFGKWDWEALANDWDEEQLGEWGLDVWQPEQEEETPETKEDEFDEEQDEIHIRCKRGDIWQLGEHRLMCGDSTDLETVKTLMGGGIADIEFSSPPYNAGFGKCITKDNGRSKYTNGSDDNLTQEEYAEFLNKHINAAMGNAKFVFCNVQMLANNKQSLIDVMEANRDILGDVIIWDKTHSQPQLAVNVLNSEFEFVFVFHDKGNRCIGTIPFHGTLKNIIHIMPTRNEFAEVHNAVFPVELPAYFIRNFAKTSVLDLFGGTGTTLIAAEQLGKRCFMMELDEHYCDVIIARWEKMTGKQAIKIN